MQTWKKLLLSAVLLGACNAGFAAEFKISPNEQAANLRARPTTRSAVLAKLEAFDEPTIIRREGNWYYVEHQTDAGQSIRGYIHKSQGAVVEYYTVSAKEGYANVRAGASANARIIGKAENGKTVLAFGEKNGWLHIPWDGSAEWPAAYIHKSQLIKR